MALSSFFDRVVFRSSTTGTGTLTAGAALPTYRPLSAIPDGTTVSYVVVEGNTWEVRQGVVGASGTTLTRGTLDASSSGGAISFNGNEIVAIDVVARDLVALGNFANPSALVGLTAVNGTSQNFMRADAAPAVDQGIAPTWTATHSFNNTIVASNGVNATGGNLVAAAGQVITGGASGGFNFKDRTTALDWFWYASGGTARLWNATNPDRWLIDVPGNVTMNLVGGASGQFQFTSNNPGFTSQISAINSGTIGTANTAAAFLAQLTNGTNAYLQLVAIGGGSPVAQINTGVGLTGGLSVIAGAGSLLLQSSASNVALNANTNTFTIAMQIAAANRFVVANTLVYVPVTTVSFGIGTSTPDSALHINRNAAASPGTIIGGSVAHLSSVDGSSASYLAEAFANGGSVAGVFMARRANGTAASPTALTTSDVILQLAAQGYFVTGGPAYSGIRASINFVAAEPWTSAAQGTSMTLNTALIGTASNTTRLQIDGNGKFGFNTPAQGGAGYLFNVGTNLDVFIRNITGLLELGGCTDNVGAYIPFMINGAPLNLQSGNPTQPVNIGLAGSAGLLNLNFRNFVMTIGEPSATGTPVLQSYTSGGGAGNWDTQLTFSGGVAGTQGRGVFGWNGILSTLTVAGTKDVGFIVSQQPGGTLAGDQYFNSIAITNWNVNNAGFNVGAFCSNCDINGSNATSTVGGFFALIGRVVTRQVSTTPNSSFNGVLGQVIVTQNIPGAATGFGVYGVNANMFILSGITGVAQISGFESDMTVQSGANPVTRTGYNTVFSGTDAVQGSTVDASFYWTMIAGTSPGWRNIFLLDVTNSNGNSGAGGNTGRLMGGNTTTPTNGGNIFAVRGGTMNITNGFDLTGLVISGNAWKSTGFQIFGQGTPYAQVSTLQTTVGGGWGTGASGTLPTANAAGTADTFMAAGFFSTDGTLRTVPYNSSGVLLGNAQQATLYVGNFTSGTGDPTPQGSTQAATFSSIKTNASAGTASAYGQTGGMIINATGGWAGTAGLTFDIASVVLSTGTRTITVSAAPTNHHYVQGMPVVFKTGTGSLAASTVIAVVNSPTSLTLSANPTGSGTATLTFWSGTPVTTPATTTPTVPNGAYNPFAGTPGDTFAINGQAAIYDNGYGIAQFLQYVIGAYNLSGVKNIEQILTAGLTTSAQLNVFGSTGVHATGWQAQATAGSGIGFGVYIANAGGSWSFWGASSSGNGFAMTTLAVSAISDPAIKRDIRKLPSAKNFVMSLDPVSFLMHRDMEKHAGVERGKRFLGFLSRNYEGIGGVRNAVKDFAEDIIQPGMKSPMGTFDGYWRDEIVPALFRGVQEVWGQVDEHEGELVRLRARVADLESRLPQETIQ